jgi:hypothetical protein
VLKDHGIIGANIKKGYRSPFSSTDIESVPVPPSRRLAQENDQVLFFIRAMTLEAYELAEEAKELRDDHNSGDTLAFGCSTKVWL